MANTTYQKFDRKGQSCVAGSRIFVQEGIYDQFLTKFTAIAADLTSKTGDPFGQGTEHGPQVSKIQFDLCLPSFSDGLRSGHFIKPTIFTDVNPDVKIVKEEIFGPVAVIIKFKDEAEVVEMAGNTTYGLAAHLFTESVSRAIRVAHAVEAGTAWVRLFALLDILFLSDPIMGFIGQLRAECRVECSVWTVWDRRELGEYALDTYTQVKAFHVNIGQKL
ncbi:ALDH-like protein [Phlegmacium glaucopus]|nr:ALDH-like protein [Phlegmacium glaucopus]